MDALDELLLKFEARLRIEPQWLPRSIAKGFISLLSLESNGIYRIEDYIQTTLNNHAHKISQMYTPGIAKVIEIRKDGHVFDSCRLFPIHTLEWCLSVLEICVQHSLELAWVKDLMFYKVRRVMEKTYGLNLTNQFFKIVKEIDIYKECDWNRNVYNIVFDIIEREKTKNDIERHINAMEISEILYNVSREPWGTSDAINFALPSEYIKAQSNENKAGIIVFGLISSVNTKVKHRFVEHKI